MASCRVCDGTDLEMCIDLGDQPWCNGFLKKTELGLEPKYPLKVLFCNNCKTAQLDYTVKKEIMFGDHTYLSGITDSLSSHFKDVAKDAVSVFKERGEKRPARVLDIGSNDGTQLLHFQELGCECLGVESSKRTATIANDRGVATLNQFFNLETAQNIGRKFDIINAAGVFFHLEELHSVCEGIKLLLDQNGIFVVQFLYMKSIMENGAFDQIYHEHLLYYTVKTVSELLKRHDLEIFDAYLSGIHGGSIIARVSHLGKNSISKRVTNLLEEECASKTNDISTYKAFADKILDLKIRDLNFLDKAASKGKSVYGFGAPVKGNTLLNFFGINTKLISCLVEKNKMRRNLYSPGSHIPIVMEDELDGPPDIYYVLAWNFKEEILMRNKELITRGIEFYFPVDPLAS
jgi:SAM-dependent methyltransferase